MKTSPKLLFLILFSFLLLLSCTEKENAIGQEENTSLPPSAGAIGDVLLVMDTNHLHTELGIALQQVLLKPYDGLPQIEMNYKINRIHFPAFGSLFKKAKTVLFTVPFEDGISENYIQRMIGEEATANIQKKGTPFYVKENVFARDQQIIFVFGKNRKQLAENLIKYGETITALIDKKEQKRVERKLYKVGERKELARKLKEDLGFSIRIPSDYKLVKGTKSFTWLRLALEETDYNIQISARPYTNESQFDSNYIANWRDELASNVDGGDTTSTKIVQDIYPVETKIIATPYKVEQRGLWKLKNNTMGGPFISEVKLSEDGTQILYIEGFIVAPGKRKRELIRELETVISSFKG